ncbi:MAG: restriction endonuclease subunit S [Methanomicrobiales archaeon]
MATRSTWPLVHFGEIAEFRNGLNFTKENFGKGIKVIGVSDFQDYIIPRYDELVEINPEGVVKNEDFLKEGDILFVRSNGNRNLIGRNLFLKCVRERIAHSAFTIRARLISKNADPRFYAYLFRSSLIRETMSAQGSGTNINNLNQRILSDMEVPIPPFQTQQKIAAILSAYDDLIENNTRRIKILEEMAQDIYREWFVHFRFPGHEGVRMVESELGLVPEGWEILPLKNIAEINSESVKRNQEPKEIGYIDIASVSTGRIDNINWMKFSDAPGRARRIVHHGDIIWSMVRPNRKSYCLIIEPDPNTIVSTGFAVIRCKKIPYTFLYHSLTKNDFVSYLTNNATGAAYPAVKTEDFENAKIVFPSNILLEQFHKIIEPFYSVIQNLSMKNTNLRRSRDLLLPKLIRGEIDVSDMDIQIHT